MIIEKFNLRAHYHDVYRWWHQRTGLVLPPDFLSDEGVIIFSDDGFPILGAWLFYTNSTIAKIDWVVANPESTKEDRAEAIERMTAHFCNLGRQHAVKYISVISGHPGLTKKMKALGFDILPDHDVLFASLKGNQIKC